MPFNFLGLPPELRLMVYERLPRQTIRHAVSLPPYVVGFSCSEMSITARVMPMSILATCKLVHKEAYSVVQKAAEDWVGNYRPVMDCTFTYKLVRYGWGQPHDAQMVFELYMDIIRVITRNFLLSRIEAVARVARTAQFTGATQHIEIRREDLPANTNLRLQDGWQQVSEQADRVPYVLAFIPKCILLGAIKSAARFQDKIDIYWLDDRLCPNSLNV